MKGDKIIISVGHIYGKPFGFGEIKKARKLEKEGKLIETSATKWHERGPKGGLKHGIEYIFREV